jgi:hypothetical protein
VLDYSPSTPLYQPESDSESEGDNNDQSTVKISKSKSFNYSSSYYPTSQQEEEGYINHHVIKSGVTIFRKQNNTPSTEPDNMSQDQSPADDQNCPDYEFEEGEVNPIQLGFNGKPLVSTEVESSIFMSTGKKFRLDGASPIDHSLIKRFISQVKNEDFKSPIEKLIDPVSWKQILRVAKGRNQDINSIPQHARLQQILSLETYVF